MPQAKLSEILKHKKPGENWYSYLAPEEYHFWDLKNPWNSKKFKKYNVQIRSVSVKGVKQRDDNSKDNLIRKNNPLHLDNGVTIYWGSETESSLFTYFYKIRIDGMIELNECLALLAEKKGIKQWETKTIEVINPKEGAICHFKRHNPDGNGVNLYLYRAEVGKDSWLYPDLLLATQELYCGNFRQYFAACKCLEQKVKMHGCVLDRSTPRLS